jgi:CBS domain-containing protein
MASNPKWRRPLSVWKKYFSTWINSPTPEAILQSLIFFDFRPVHGDFLLAEKLRAFLGHEMRGKDLFLAHMAGIAVKNIPPLDFFGKFSGEKQGIHKGKFNIKINGLCPIIDAARLSALERECITPTSEIRAGDRHGTVSEFCEEFVQAFDSHVAEAEASVPADREENGAPYPSR